MSTFVNISNLYKPHKTKEKQRLYKPLQESSYNQTTGENESTKLIEFIVDDTAAEKLTAVDFVTNSEGTVNEPRVNPEKIQDM